MFTFFS